MTQSPPVPTAPPPDGPKAEEGALTRSGVGCMVVMAVVLAVLLWFLLSLLFTAVFHMGSGRLVAGIVAVVLAGGIIGLAYRKLNSATHRMLREDEAVARLTGGAGDGSSSVAVLPRARAALIDADQGRPVEQFLAPRRKELLDWRTGPGLLIGLPVVAVGLVLLALMITGGPVTCGGQAMGSGDRCVNLRTGASRSAGDLASAPVHHWWFWVILIGIVLAFWVFFLYHRLVPGKGEVEAMRALASAERRGLRTAIDQTGDDAVREVLAEYATAYDAEVARLAARYRITMPVPSS